jgi:hypothetical protein
MKFLLFLAVMYFVPTIIAFVRQRAHRRHVAFINLFLGWTVVGWFLSLYLAL